MFKKENEILVQNLDKNGRTLSDDLKSAKVRGIYDDILSSQRDINLSKRSRQMLYTAILELYDLGVSPDEILSMFIPDPAAASLPIIPRNAPADPREMEFAAAQPILLAIERNLPICQEKATWNSKEFSVLHLAYLVNLVDHYRYLCDRIRIVNYDSKCVQDWKQASMQKRDDLGELSMDFVYTWNNVGVDILDFLGYSAFPDSIPLYSDGYLSPDAPFPELLVQSTAGITETIIEENFVEFYIKLVTQLSVSQPGTLSNVDDYESDFLYDSSLWAYNVPTSDDPNSFTSRYVDVRHDEPIPPSSEWLALTPLVDNTNIVNSNIKVRFTAYSGMLHYANRLRLGQYGRCSEIADPVFIYAPQIADMFHKALVLAEIDLSEIVVDNVMNLNATGLSHFRRSDLTLYLMNFLNVLYASTNAVMAYSLPTGLSTWAGMEFLPNVNYSNVEMFADINEQLELLGPISKIEKKRGRAWVNKIPVLVHYTPFTIAEADDFDELNSMFIDSDLLGGFSASPYLPVIPLPGPQLYCYTRGDAAQTLWYRMESSLAPYGNVRILSCFEGFKKVSDYDKYTVLFKEPVPESDIKALNRHFLIYSRGGMPVGEKNLLRLTIGQIMVLGLESLTFEDKLERTRTFQTFKDFQGSEFVDSAIDPLIEMPNNLFDIDSQISQLYRRYKYQESATDRTQHLIAVFMAGEGGNFWTTLRDGLGSVAKIVAPVGAEILGKTVGLPGMGSVVSGLIGTYDEHRTRVKRPIEARLRTPRLVVPPVRIASAKKMKKIKEEES